MSGLDEPTEDAELQVACDARRFELKLSDEGRGFVFDHRTGDVYTLNAVGALVLRCLLDGYTVTAIAQEVSIAYSIPPRQAFDDVKEFLAELVRMDVVDVQS